MSTRRVVVLCSLGEVRRKVAELVAEGWEVVDLGDDRLAENCADTAILKSTGYKPDKGLDIARLIHCNNDQARIIIIARYGAEDLNANALRIGADDRKAPVHPLRLTRTDGDADPARTAYGTTFGTTTPAIVGETPAINTIKEFIPRVASCDSSVLITGETGTGKEMVAAEIHRLSARSRKKFVCVNCSALPETLIESELFGYEKGAFTGAVSARDGKFAEAEGGTLFFDEIGDMSPLAQAKILRAIESREYSRLGGNRSIRTNVRLIAATNRHLESLIRDERFRPDLFFRLNVARIELPTLRSRRADIRLLIHHFIRHYNPIFKMRVERIANEAVEALLNYSWPGNVRELKNVIEVIFLNLRSTDTEVRRIPEQVLAMWRQLSDVPQDERASLVQALLETHWNVSAAARKLDWSRMTVYRKIEKYGIQSERTSASPKRHSQGQ